MSNGRSHRGRLLCLAVALAVMLGLPAAYGLRDATVGAASPLSVSVGSASVVVTARSQESIFFPITLSQPATSSVSVSYFTGDGTAKAGKSYRASSGSVTFAVDPKTGLTPLTEFAGVVIYPSTWPNGGGAFSITLYNPVGMKLGNTVGIGTIIGRAAGGPVRVSAGDMSEYDGASGGNRSAIVHVTLSRPAPQPVSVDYSVTGASAVPGANYQAPASGTLNIAAGSLDTWIGITVISGSVLDQPRTLSVTLTNPTGADVSRGTGTVTLIPEPSAAAAHYSGSTPPTQAPAVRTASESPTPAGMLFDDEFNGTSLDTSKWQPNWLGNNNSTITKPINGSELSCYDPAQVSEPGDGYLHLNAVARPCLANNGVTYNYASGLVEAKPHFTFTYGYLEARMYLPPNASQTANWPAFWADGTGTWPTTGELDVMEGLHGNDCFHFHSPSGGPGGCAPMTAPSGWHTFGARWAPGTVTFFYDGAQVGQITSGVTDAPMYPILNLAVGGEGGAASVPSSVLVDWVRVTP